MNTSMLELAPEGQDGAPIDRRVKVAVRIRPLLDKPSERYDATCAFRSMAVETPKGHSGSPRTAGGGGGPGIGSNAGDTPPGTTRSSAASYNNDEGGGGSSTAGPTGLTLANPETKDSHVFAYDVVFDPSDGQEAVFDQSISQPLSEALEDGSHFTVVTYGQTGSGKTFTLLGEPPRAEQPGGILTPTGTTSTGSPIAAAAGRFPTAGGAVTRRSGPRASTGFKSAAEIDDGTSMSEEQEHQFYLHQDSGVYLRLMYDILAFKRSKRNQAHVVIALSVVEIYNDTIRDLLKEKGPVQFREIGEDLLLINQTQVTIRSQRHVVEYFEVAYKNRAVSSTQMNTESSRSHALFFVDVFQQVKTPNNPEPPDTSSLAEHAIQSLAAAQNLGKVQQPGLSDRILGQTAGRKSESLGGSVARSSRASSPAGGNPSNDFSLYPVTHSRIILVDLAGSERVKKSGVTGQQLHETLYVNKSLSALGLVVNHLCLGSKHVPFRDSKMTRILRNSFVLPNSKILFIANISPASGSFGETLTSLRFASRLKELKPPVSSNQPYMQASVLEDQTLRKKHIMEELSADVRIAEGTIAKYNRILRFHSRPFGIAPLSSPYQPTSAKAITTGLLPSTQAVRSLMVSYKQQEDQRAQNEESARREEYQEQVRGLISQFDEHNRRYGRLIQKGSDLRKQLEAEEGKQDEVKTALKAIREEQLKLLSDASGRTTDPQSGENTIKSLELEVTRKKQQSEQVQSRVHQMRIDLRKGAIHVDEITEEWKRDTKEVNEIEQRWVKVTDAVSRLRDYLDAKNGCLEARLENSSLERLSRKAEVHLRESEGESAKKLELAEAAGASPAKTGGGGTGKHFTTQILPEAKFKAALECKTISPLSFYFSARPPRPALYKSWGPSPPPSPEEVAILPPSSASPPLSGLSKSQQGSANESKAVQPGPNGLVPFHRQGGSGSGSRIAQLREESSANSPLNSSTMATTPKALARKEGSKTGRNSGGGGGSEPGSGDPSPSGAQQKPQSSESAPMTTGGNAADGVHSNNADDKENQIPQNVAKGEEPKVEREKRKAQQAEDEEREVKLHNQEQEDKAVRYNISILKDLLGTLDAITASPGGLLQQEHVVGCLTSLNEVQVTQGGVVEVLDQLHIRGIDVVASVSAVVAAAGSNVSASATSNEDQALHATPVLLKYLSELGKGAAAAGGTVDNNKQAEQSAKLLSALSPLVRVLQAASLFTSVATLSSPTGAIPPYDTSVLVDWLTPWCLEGLACLGDTNPGSKDDTTSATATKERGAGSENVTAGSSSSGLRVHFSDEYVTKQQDQDKVESSSRNSRAIPPLSLVAFVDCLMTGCGL